MQDRVDLDEIEKLLGAATPGPWAQRSEPQHYGTATYITEADGHGRVARMWSGRTATNANADLIVAAVNTLPAMIAELRGLREVYDALRSYQTTPGNIDERWDEVETAVAAVMKRGV